MTADARVTEAAVHRLVLERAGLRQRIADLTHERDAARAEVAVVLELTRWAEAIRALMDFPLTDEERSAFAVSLALAPRGAAFLAEHEDLTRDRDELRAILAPLLDVPYIGRIERPMCVFCAAYMTEDHAPDCPTRGRDALLGREATP